MAAISYLIAPVESPPRYGLDHEFGVDSPEFLATIAGATGVPVTRDNRIDLLNNGDEFYPVMLREIAGAQTSITIEAYIYWEGEIGRTFAAALAERARAGVRVKILLDAIGSNSIGTDILGVLESGGCQVAWYNPIKLVHDRPVQQPDAPQVAHHRRAGRLHGRRRHCRPVARARTRQRALAGHADPRRGSGGDAAADGLRAELARTHQGARLRARSTIRSPKRLARMWR